MKNVVVLGSTGSIGTSTIKVAEDLPDRIRLLGLAAGNNAELLVVQARKHRPEAISVSDPDKAQELREALGPACEVCSGTGVAACAFLFKDAYGNRLRVTTEGEELPNEKSYARVNGFRFVCD